MDIEERKQFYLDHFERQKTSGLSIKTFCKENGISSSSFYSWRKRLNNNHTLSSKPVSKDHNISSNIVNNTLEDDDTEPDFIVKLIKKKDILFKKFILTISSIFFINVICLIFGMNFFITLLIFGSYLGAILIYFNRNDSLSKAINIESDEII